MYCNYKFLHSEFSTLLMCLHLNPSTRLHFNSHKRLRLHCCTPTLLLPHTCTLLRFCAPTLLLFCSSRRSSPKIIAKVTPTRTAQTHRGGHRSDSPRRSHTGVVVQLWRHPVMAPTSALRDANAHAPTTTTRLLATTGDWPPSRGLCEARAG